MRRGLFLASCVLLAAPTSLGGALDDCERLLRRGDEERAARCFEKASAIPASAPGALTRLSALREAGRAGGWLLRILGIREAVAGAPKAEATLGSAVAAFNAAGDLRGEAVARATLADFLSRRRRFAEAEQELRRADALAAKSGRPDAVARVRYREALVALRRQDPLGGLARMDAGEEAAQASGDDDLMVEWHETRAILLWTAGRYSESLAAYRLQIAALERLGDGARIADVLANMAFSTTDAGKKRAFAEDALDRAVRAGNLNAEVKARFTLAEIDEGDAGLTHALRGLDAARRLGDVSQLQMALRAAGFRLAKSGDRHGLDLLREAVESATKAGDPAEKARCSFILSRALWEIGPREEAIRASLASLDAAEETRTGPASAESRAVRFGQWNRLYYRAAGYLLSGALLDRPGDVPPDEIALAFGISERMKARSLLDSLDAAAQIRDVAPVFASVEALRAALAPDEALVSFLINAEKSTPSSSAFDGGSWAFTVSRESVRAFRLRTDRKELEGQASLFVGLVEGRSGIEATGAAALYDVLLKDALAALPAGVRRLLVVPDRALHYLPMGLLRQAPGAEPVASRYEVVTIPSATVWLRLRGLPETPASALSFADPTLPEPAGSSGASPAERSVRLGPLAFARREGRSLVARAGPGSRLLVGDAASERALKNASFKSYGVVHLGAHALADDEGGRSMLILTPGEGEDGRLRLDEIRRLPLGGQLVVLAACRSTTGTYVHGEGALGLSSAFLLSGARAVLGTLWSVRDDEAEEFSKAFFAHLSGGRTASAALAGAQKTLRARGRPPAAWAAFVLIGDGSIAPIRRAGLPWSAGLVVLAAAGVLAAVVFLSRTRPAEPPEPR